MHPTATEKLDAVLAAADRVGRAALAAGATQVSVRITRG